MGKKCGDEGCCGDMPSASGHTTADVWFERIAWTMFVAAGLSATVICVQVAAAIVGSGVCS